MCFWNLTKALFMSPTWATWAILIAPLLVLVVWIVVQRQSGVAGVGGDSPVYGAVGESWRALGWTILLTALGFYALDVTLFFTGKTRAQNKTFEQKFVQQSTKTQGLGSMANGFSTLLGSVDASDVTQLLVEQGSERKTGSERSDFLQEGDAVSESMLKKSLAKLSGMAIGKRKEWFDTRHYKDLLGDLSQNEWGSLLGTLGAGDGVGSTILSSRFSDSELADADRGRMWDAVVALSPLPPWMKVAYQAGCVLQAKLVKFFIIALGFLRGAVWLLLWLSVGFGMVMAGGAIVKESKDSLYEKLPA
ncbi:MAG: hypothetical protein IKQ15_04910 [Kiritimatiellae bacterium]|nr:hypothetical protein [Kiritimatiellia bacterium]